MKREQIITQRNAKNKNNNVNVFGFPYRRHIISFLAVMLFFSCSKEEDPVPNIPNPTVISTQVSEITSESATSGGNVTSNGGSDIIAKGVCWSVANTPTIDNTKTFDGTGAGSFSSSLTGLLPNTTYFLRAYATNSSGTYYGEEINFTTNEGSVDVPMLTTAATLEITAATASSGAILLLMVEMILWTEEYVGAFLMHQPLCR